MKTHQTSKEMKKRIKEYLVITSASAILLTAASCAHMPRYYSVIEQRLPKNFVVEKDLGKVGNMPALDAYIALKTGLVYAIDIDSKNNFFYDINLEEKLKELPQDLVDSLTSMVSYKSNSLHIDKKRLYEEIVKEITHENYPKPKDIAPNK